MQMKIIPGDTCGKLWNEVFEMVTDLDYVIWEGTAKETTDVTLYFKGSEEPFPLTSLRRFSHARLAVEDLLYN